MSLGCASVQHRLAALVKTFNGTIANCDRVAEYRSTRRDNRILRWQHQSNATAGRREGDARATAGRREGGAGGMSQRSTSSSMVSGRGRNSLKSSLG